MNYNKSCCLAILTAAGIASLGAGGVGLTRAMAQDSAIVKSEFIADNPPYPMSHGSTIVQTPNNLLVAWFGGSAEGAPDVNIWLAANYGTGWSRPSLLATGYQQETGMRYACWNPVLFKPQEGPLMLFYRVGPSPSRWWTMLMTSRDSGKTWSAPRRLPKGFYGPIRNQPVELPDGKLLCGSSTEDSGWRVHMEWTDDQGTNWHKTKPLNSALEYGAIQPTILLHTNGDLQILCRSKWKIITQCWSKDNGRTWSDMTPTVLPNPNSAIDAIMLHDGRALLVYNHSTTKRTPLNVAISKDGIHWQAALVLENGPGEFSYPFVIQTSDGMVHITYSWNRKRIKHVVIDPFKLHPRPMPDGDWP